MPNTGCINPSGTQDWDFRPTHLSYCSQMIPMSRSHASNPLCQESSGCQTLLLHLIYPEIGVQDLRGPTLERIWPWYTKISGVAPDIALVGWGRERRKPKQTTMTKKNLHSTVCAAREWATFHKTAVTRRI